MLLSVPRRATTVKLISRPAILFVIPLVLSAFTHLWNPVGFPAIHSDEGRYLTKAVNIIRGISPIDPGNYYHPFFGQIILAGTLGLVDYPDLAGPIENGKVQPIENLWLAPRILMGVFAIVDTFIIYKIAEIRYNRNIAFIASLLFAVMPLTWMTRRIYLDSILVPFLLLSVLFALMYANTKPKSKEKNRDKTSKILVLLSGIFLGLAIFTKIPAFTMIPLVAGILTYSNHRALGSLAIWLTPVLLIPAIYPGYAILQGEYDEWRRDISYQTDRIRVNVFQSIETLFIFDPVLTVLGIAGIIFAAFKRDVLPFLWTVPFGFFLYWNGYSSDHFWIVVLPAFCIAAAVFIVDIAKMTAQKIKVTQVPITAYSDKIFNKIKLSYYLRSDLFPLVVSAVPVSLIVIFGMVSTVILTTTTSLNSHYFEAVAVINTNLPNKSNSDATNNNDNKVTVIGFPQTLIYFWIPKYILDKNADFLEAETFNDNRDMDYLESRNFETERALLIIDDRFKRFLESDRFKKLIEWNVDKMLYDSSNLLAKFEDTAEMYDRNNYPYTNLNDYRAEEIQDWNSLRSVEIRKNY
jgi:hypothetical protein